MQANGNQETILLKKIIVYRIGFIPRMEEKFNIKSASVRNS